MMRVQFYHNAADSLVLACELIEKAYTSGRRVAVRIADRSMGRRFDSLLWTRVPLSFIPHVSIDSPLAAETAVIIGGGEADIAWPHQDILFNLSQDVPVNFSRFRMVIEIVGQAEVEKAPARQRWLHYKAQNCALEAFDAVHRKRL